MDTLNGAEQNARGIVVMKFGGTSVEDAAAFRRLREIVRTRLDVHPVLVVSALAKITDQLLSAAQAAAEGKLEFSTAVIADIRLRHQEIAAELLASEEYLLLCREFEAEFAALHRVLCEVAVAGQLTPPLQDAALTFGERLSSKLAVAVLREYEIPAVHFDSASLIVTDNRHTIATPLWDRTYENVCKALQPSLRASLVPVLGGFIAATESGVPSTLGRGGSDLTASIVGAALRARRIEIWTDVDGIMTTDPNVCPEARRIPQISFEDAAELAESGAKVLHHATLAPAMRADVPVQVLNSRKPECRGTEIRAHVDAHGFVRALAAKRGVAVVEVDSAVFSNTELVAQVSEAFERHNCPIELLSATRGHLTVLANSTAVLPNVAADLQSVAKISWQNHKAVVCVLGENLRRKADVASRVFAAVSDMDVRVLCHGHSDRSLTFLIEEDKADESLRRLHALFFSERKPPSGAHFSSATLCQAGESWL